VETVSSDQKDRAGSSHGGLDVAWVHLFFVIITCVHDSLWKIFLKSYGVE